MLGSLQHQLDKVKTKYQERQDRKSEERFEIYLDSLCRQLYFRDRKDEHDRLVKKHRLDPAEMRESQRARLERFMHNATYYKRHRQHMDDIRADAIAIINMTVEMLHLQHVWTNREENRLIKMYEKARGTLMRMDRGETYERHCLWLLSACAPLGPQCQSTSRNTANVP